MLDVGLGSAMRRPNPQEEGCKFTTDSLCPPTNAHSTNVSSRSAPNGRPRPGRSRRASSRNSWESTKTALSGSAGHRTIDHDRRCKGASGRSGHHRRRLHRGEHRLSCEPALSQSARRAPGGGNPGQRRQRAQRRHDAQLGQRHRPRRPRTHRPDLPADQRRHRWDSRGDCPPRPAVDYRCDGTVTVYTDPARAEAAHAAVSAENALGIPTQFLTTAELQQRLQLRQVCGAVLDPAPGRSTAPNWCAACGPCWKRRG